MRLLKPFPPAPTLTSDDEGLKVWLAWSDRVETMMLRRLRWGWFITAVFTAWIVFNAYRSQGQLQKFYVVMLLAQCYSVKLLLDMGRARRSMLAETMKLRALANIEAHTREPKVGELRVYGPGALPVLHPGELAQAMFSDETIRTHIGPEGLRLSTDDADGWTVSPMPGWYGRFLRVRYRITRFLRLTGGVSKLSASVTVREKK